MLAVILRESFARAHARIGLIFVDILWKAVWLVCSVAAVALVVSWFGSYVQQLAWEDTGVRSMNLLVAMAVLREFWRTLRVEVLLTAMVLALLLAAGWFLLEALIRSRILFPVGAVYDRAFFLDATNNARSQTAPTTDWAVFLLSRVSKTAVLVTAGLILLVVALKGAAVLALILFLTLAFCLSLVETVIRADAVDLLGTDLFRVIALIGILVSFEMMVVASFTTMLTAGFLNVTRLGDALVMLGLTGISAVFLTLLHSYLLLVRFSAVTIMRQNVVAV
ncbi:MAG TPA: hypothetical protein VKY31_11110 [Terriglobia bacterium]|nr:hypothetical protein [Terriglobia bacterium]